VLDRLRSIRRRHRVSADDGLADGVVFLPVLVLSVPISVSNSRVVKRSMTSVVLVITVSVVAMKSVPGPVTVAVKQIERVLISVLVTTTISHTS
jgi:hypothetical protein